MTLTVFCVIFITMTMHLAQGLSTINTRKRKVKITKAKMAELELKWRQHNKDMKSKGLHDLRYEKLDDYINYCFGKVKKPDPRDYKYFKPNKPQRNVLAERDAEHRKKYPSLMEEQMKAGTFNSESMSRGTKKEPMKYTGTLIKGIATMHKSNAVPVIDDQHAKDIARMRR